jgi:hypothetical protein
MTELEDGSGVLLHLETKFYFTLNPTGVFVWKTLAAGKVRDLDGLASTLSASFEVEPQTAARDAAALLEELRSEALVR